MFIKWSKQVDNNSKSDESRNPYYNKEYKPSPEDFYNVETKRPGPLHSAPPVRFALPGAFMYLLFYIVSSIYWNGHYENYMWVSNHSVFNQGEWWRLVTALFVHSDLGHLLSNGPLFIFFAYYLRAYYGFTIFPLLAFLLGIATNAITVYNYGLHIRLIGASGMVYAIVAIWLTLYVRFDVVHSIPVRLLRAVGFSLVMLFPTTFSPQTSYLAHTVGFFLGIVVTILALPVITIRTFTKKNSKQQSIPELDI